MRPVAPEHDNALAEAIRNAGNVVLGEWLKTDKVPVIDQSGAHTGNLNIEKIVPPIPLLEQSALACAHFALPKVPVKVNSYWAYKAGAGDIPTLPIVVFQIYALTVYDDFIRLLKAVSPELVRRLPASGKAVVTEKKVKEIILQLRNYFEQNPAAGKSLLEKIRLSKTPAIDAKKNQILASLIRMYQSPKNPYLNYYGPAGTIRTIPYHRIIEDRKNASGDAIPGDLKGKVVFIGLSEQLRPEVKDGFYTVFSQPDGLDISGVEIAASAFANLLEDLPVKPLKIGRAYFNCCSLGNDINYFVFTVPTRHCRRQRQRVKPALFGFCAFSIQAPRTLVPGYCSVIFSGAGSLFWNCIVEVFPGEQGTSEYPHRLRILSAGRCRKSPGQEHVGHQGRRSRRLRDMPVYRRATIHDFLRNDGSRGAQQLHEYVL